MKTEKAAKEVVKEIKGKIEDTKGLTVKKNEDFSEWYTQVVQKAELADLRYNVKGFLVFQPWSVMVMEKMYSYLEKTLQQKRHKPYFFPTLIPESNLKRESTHIIGFTPEVFWVTEGGDKKFEERLALRPTSETAFYQMFSLWIRSYKDLPFKTYQRANVFRYETKATRPFLRSREFHWIETHCVHATEKDAEKQVLEDMQTTKEVLHDVFGLPFIFFERPAWDKFPGADRTFAADVLNPDGRVVQQPSTHLLSQAFSKGFGVKYTGADGKENYGWITCYGPAVSRIFASVVIVHGDDKGLRLPWNLAPIQVVIVPIVDDPKVMEKADNLYHKLSSFSNVEIDMTNKSAGEKFNHWEMKGVPVRIDLGLKDIKEKSVTIFRRDTGEKKVIREENVLGYIKKLAEESGKILMRQADKVFDDLIINATDLKKAKQVIESGGIVRCGFCSIEKDGASCSDKVEESTGAKVRGRKFDEIGKTKTSGVCIVCGKPAKETVYIAREY
ncbi:MAG: proline--tRNA ligase [Candidatus Liptonbacteria bacterium]|nr:proline--tRNA ligase [Candidatus Pacearchaeota archaeon]MBM3257033.1 proline--tRNA ligase [Candidatus Liptonbacteria bacterium]